MRHSRIMISAVLLSVLTAGCSNKKPVASATTAATAAATSTPEATATAASTAASEDSAAKAAEYVAGMDLKSKVEQVMVPAIRTWNGSDFTTMNDSVASILSTYHFGGIILFAENMTGDSAQAINLTQSMQINTINGGGTPLLIGTDQECGNVYRLLSGTDMPSSMALCATGDTQNAYQSGTIISKELKALGLNLDYAPDLDVNENPANPVIGIRSYSDDGSTVASYATQFVEGMNQNGIICTGKHFPGHGDTSQDSHTGLPQVNKTKDQLESTDLIPFKQAVSEGVEMIMSAHIQYPSIETGTYTSISDGREVYLPSTLSHTMITDILRNELGFQGVVSTDSLQMDAIKNNFSTRDTAKLALNAGVDCLLMPVNIADDNAKASLDSYIQDIIDMVNDGEISEDTLNTAVTRIIKLKYDHGIMDSEYSAANTQNMLSTAAGQVGTADNYAVNRTISQKAATVLQNNNQILPFKASEGSKIVTISPNGDQANVAGYAYNRLTAEGIISNNVTEYLMSEDYGNNYWNCYNSIAGSQLVIVTSIMFNGNDINYSQSSLVYNMVTLIEHAKQLGIPVVAISTGLPYDSPLLREADAVLCTYDYVGMPSIDGNGNPTQAYSESIPGALDVIFGKVSATGKLPVNIYGIYNGSFTSDIVWARGSSAQ